MVKSKIHPKFFHALAPGFHTHLTIPEDFFVKYIQGTSAEKKNIVELKPDASDKTWKVKTTGQSLSEGWEEFAVANNLEIGDVVVFQYEGDLVFSVFDLGPNCSEIPDITPPSNNSETQDDIGKTLLKKRIYTTTAQVDLSSENEDGDNEDYIEFPRKKKAKKDNVETESFVVLVTDLSLRTDTLNLPQHFTNSNGFLRNSHKIVLRDEWERSWALDLAFNKSCDTFYISRGWGSFCNDNDQTAGGFFMFKLVEKGETPVLSFSPTGPASDRRQRECSEATGRESLSTGLSSEEENIEGDSSEDECISMGSLTEIEKKKYRPRRTSYTLYLPRHKRSITFTLPPDYVKIKWLCLPKPFLKANGIDKPGKMYLLGKDGKKWPTKLYMDIKGSIKIGSGWKDFVEANGLGTDFTLKLTWEDTTPVLSLCPAYFSIDIGAGGGCSETNQKKSFPIRPCSCKNISKDENFKDKNRKEDISSWERGKNHLRGRDSTPSNRNPFVILKIVPSSVKNCRLVLPAQFARENSISKPGMMIYLSRKDGTKWLTTVLHDNKGGRMSLGKGWKEFAEANDLKSGDSFKVELIWEDATPILRLVCSEANEKVLVSTTPASIDLSSAIPNRFVTLALTSEDVKACKLHLPSEFMKANGINKLGEITILGENRTEWSGYLLSREGTVALGHGWKEFCEANGVKLGESFTLEFINEQNTTPVLKFCSQKTTYNTDITS